MKKLAIAMLALLVTPAAFAAQFTCASPNGPYSGPFVRSGDTTCGAGNVNEFTTVCGGQTSLGPTNVYQINVGSATNSFTVTLTQTDATYNAAIFLVGAGSCAQSTNCQDENDATGAGVNNTETITETNIPAGTYYLVVGSTSAFNTTAGSSGCGSYNLNVTGTLPVKLKNFAID